jgi:hypothetical protein
VASRWPHRFPLVAFSSRSTSASVRYSRVRRSPLGGRLGVTVRFTVVGLTSFRCDFATTFRVPAKTTVRIMADVSTVDKGCPVSNGAPVQSDLRFWQGRPGHFKLLGLKGAAAAEVHGPACAPRKRISRETLVCEGENKNPQRLTAGGSIFASSDDRIRSSAGHGS